MDRSLRRALRLNAAFSSRSWLATKFDIQSAVDGVYRYGHGLQPSSSLGDMPWNPAACHKCCQMSTISNSYFNQNVHVPMEFPQKKKKPFLRTRKEYNKIKKAEGIELKQPPANGLLVPELVPVALDTLKARGTLLSGLHRLIKIFPVKACRFCPAVHVGPVGHRIASCLGRHNGVRHGRHDWISGGVEDILPGMDAFHLSDRLGKPIMHEERYKIPKVPAIVELCIQAGADVVGYPTKRRIKPVLMIEKKVVEFDELDEDQNKKARKYTFIPARRFDERYLFIEESSDYGEVSPLNTQTLAALAEKTLKAWFMMRSGVKKLMSKYMVFVCGYCPQIHVGPKGTKTCDCRAYKHHQRSGHHGWQEASIDDLIPPIYVWHVRDRNGPPLATDLRVFYGAAPAVVELCIQAGANVPEEYKAMMRLDVVIPDLSELDMVA